MSYPLLCALLGVAVGALPALVHGPIHRKFDVLYLKGVVAVWAWYTARGLIGFLVGITRWPASWWPRGPLCAAVNFASAVAVGTVVAGLAYVITGRQHL